jgi:hypothetical protein
VAVASVWLPRTGSEFDEMRHEMKHVFEETIQDIERILKDLIREYETAA